MMNLVLAKMILASFFVMSGFFLEMHNSFQSVDKRMWTKFEINHFSRFFPLQWLCVAAWLTLTTTKLNASLPYHFLLVQSWIPDGNAIFYTNESSWFVSTLLFSYLLFPLLSSFTKRIPAKCSILVLACFMALITYLNTTTVPTYYRHIFPPARMVDFAIGVVLYQNLRKLFHNDSCRQLFQKLVKALDVVLICIIIVACTFSFASLSVTVAWIFISVILGVFTLSARWNTKGLLYKVLSNKAFTQLGKISFEIYMIHEIVFGGVKRVAPILGLQYHGAAYITIGIIATMAASYFIHRFFLVPISKWVRKWCDTWA